MTMTLSGDGTITGLVAGGLPNATVTADDLAAGAALNSVSDGVFFRNRIINGDMRIDQRNAGAAVTISSGSNSSYCVDRWQGFQNTDGEFTLQQVTDAPAGFTNSLRFTTTTADASLGATQFVTLRQMVEGFNTADLGFGAAGAASVTLSFWTKSSLTGTFGGALLNSAENRSYPFTYTISAANTWEQKTVTITGDTTGTWPTNNGIGFRLTFGLGVGSTYSGTAGAWTGSSFIYTATGAVSVIGTLNATWQITGVQLEVGSVATPFERRPYGTELALCQRYCFAFKPLLNGIPIGVGQAYDATNAIIAIVPPVTMRAVPTVTRNGLSMWNAAVSSDLSVSSLTISANSQTSFLRLDVVVASGLTAGQAAFLHGSTSPSGTGFLILSSEL